MVTLPNKHPSDRRKKRVIHAAAAMVHPDQPGPLCPVAHEGSDLTMDRMQVGCGHCRRSLGAALRRKEEQTL